MCHTPFEDFALRLARSYETSALLKATTGIDTDRGVTN